MTLYTYSILVHVKYLGDKMNPTPRNSVSSAGFGCPTGKGTQRAHVTKAAV